MPTLNLAHVTKIAKIGNIAKVNRAIPDDYLVAIAKKNSEIPSNTTQLSKLLNDLAEFLGNKAKGQRFNDEIKTVLDEAVGYIKRNRKDFESQTNKVKSYLKKARPVRYRTTKMLKKYVGEETGKGWCAPNKVKYLDDVERAKYELAIVDGKFYTFEGQLFDTSNTKSLFTYRKAIFVMSNDGRIFASTYHYKGSFHHSSFLSGKPVSSAGELEVVNGILKEVTNKSGHYWPNELINNQFIKNIKEQGVDVENVIITSIK